MYNKDKFSSQSSYYQVKIIAVYFGVRVSKEKAGFYKKIISSINKKIKIYLIREDETNTELYPKLICKEL